MTRPAGDPRASLPSVDALLRAPEAEPLLADNGHDLLVSALRDALAAARQEVAAGAAAPSPSDLLAAAAGRLRDLHDGDLRPVLNATGIVLHTNLGRAALSPEAAAEVTAATGPTSLELDLGTGRRGSRTAQLGLLAARATGAEDATVVNNGAAALLLALTAVADGGEVTVSRGEQIEIGGSFRLPEVVAASGAHMIEVGTTNRTRLADHRAALTERTAVLLKVHRSNFRLVGFTEDVDVAELAELGRAHDLPVVYDLGGGLLEPVGSGPLAHEPAVTEALAAGADLVLFSGDKLLGGPQAGIIVGRRELVDRCRRHPLARALRVDKLQRAALEATLHAHLRGDGGRLPTHAALRTTRAELLRRATTIAAAMRAGGWDADARETDGAVGGGTLPGVQLPSAAVTVAVPQPDRLATRLRTGTPAVVGRVADGRVVLDLLAVEPAQDEQLTELLRMALR